MDGVTQTTGTGATKTSQVGNAFEKFSSEDFLKIMFAELSKQDPLQPNDSKALLDQIGQIRSIESDLQLTRKLEDMARQNQVTVAGSLLGKFAQGKTSSGVTVSGFVDSVTTTKDGAVLNLSSGFSVAMDKLERIIDPAIIGGEGPGGDDDDDDSTDGGTTTPPTSPGQTGTVTIPTPPTNTGQTTPPKPDDNLTTPTTPGTPGSGILP